MTWSENAKYTVAWAAGFWDGEGNATYCERRYRQGHGVCRSLGLQVAQVDRRSLDRLCSALGLGKVRGPYKPKNPNGQPYFVWGANGRGAAVQTLDLLRPYLGEGKVEQLESAIAKWDAYVLKPVQCIHGTDKKRCRICRVEWTKRGWETRRRGENVRL